MNEWQTLTLADVCSVITDGAHQSPKTVSRGKPMASVKDLTRFGVDLTSARHIATEDFEALVKQGCKPHFGDVLIAKYGNSALDTVCTVDHPLDAVLLSSVAILRPDPKHLDSVFLKFYLSSPETIDYLKSNFISGAAIPRVVLRDFKRAEIRLPSLDVQRRIAEVLQSIDSKIDLNRRINQTLEAIAKAIFKSWFVDFDPVKAKIAAKERWLAQHSPLPSGEGSGVRALSTKPRLPEAILSFARENRAHATDAEALMWRLLRNRQFGAKFRRQHPQPPYILDFYCHEHRLAIELDGGQHYTAEGGEADRARSVALQQQGITVLRFSNREVLLETEAVLEKVWHALTPTPLPEGEGLEDAMLRAAMSAISGIPEAKLDALKLHPSPSGTTTGMSEVEQRLQQLPRGAGGEGSRYDDLAAIAALFPDAMEESELGEIPRGWEANCISQFGDVVCGKTPSKANPEYFGEGIPFIKIPDMHNSMYVVSPSERLTSLGEVSQAKKTIPSGSICVSCIATVGKVVITHEPSQTNQQINSIVPKLSQYTAYIYFQMKEKEKEFHDLASGGSATLNMNTSTFSKVSVLNPEFEVLEKFSALVAPLFSEILARQKQSALLSETRDTLLPKLLSGELSVTEAIAEVEAD